MNLVLSGPVDESLLAAVVKLSEPVTVNHLHKRAWRLERVGESPTTRSDVAACCALAKVDHAYIDITPKFSDIKLLAIDMDSTLITIECVDELADFAGKKAEVAAITRATMRGEISDFSESLQLRVALLEGLAIDSMRRVYEERLHLSDGAAPLLNTAARNGAHLMLISGGFTYFAERLGKLLSFDSVIANRLEIVDGKLTGRIMGPIVDSTVKAERVEQALRALRCSREQAVVIGDGANDVPMMKCVTNSIAYHAKPIVREEARLRIDYGPLSTTIDFFA